MRTVGVVGRRLFFRDATDGPEKKTKKSQRYVANGVCSAKRELADAAAEVERGRKQKEKEQMRREQKERAREQKDNDQERDAEEFRIQFYKRWVYVYSRETSLLLDGVRTHFKGSPFFKGGPF